MIRPAPYDGDAHMAVHGEKVRVTVEANNVRAEVYVSRDKAREIAENILASLGAEFPGSRKERRDG